MTINCKGELIDLSTPKVMGILNVTPDSFYDGGRFTDTSPILQQVEKMLAEGATFIDVGAYSSRPGATDISSEEEIRRIEPVVELLMKTYPKLLLSIDTFRAKVAQRCLELGASMVNDISGGHADLQMLLTIKEFQVPYVAMHMKGNPRNMMDKTHYDDLLQEVLYYFSEIIEKTQKLQIHDLIIDPGFGFAKTLDQNYELLSRLDLLQSTGLPILAGLSRKSMIYKLLEGEPEKALNGTTALNMAALMKGANILRVHDVKEAVECIRLYTKIKAHEP